MPRLFRKSKLPTDAPAPALRPPAKLVQNLTSLPQGGPAALAASSTAITLPVGSTLSNIRDPSTDGTTARGRDRGWQTAYSAAKMAVEIAKESSDMFLPLKAVVGAMSVLIKSYDQTSDNAENVKEIVRRVQSLSGVLASPVSEGDYPEKGRRMELQRKLEKVVMSLEPLSEQSALVRFFRNADNAKTLTGFIQELANAITDYQVSVQQGVYERTRDILSETMNIRNDTKDILGTAELEKLEPVRNAGYQAGHHDKCLPRTRESVLEEIMLWAKNTGGQNVFWLNGLAGTGKSTIAQSFSEIMANEGILGASFFCSRDYLDRKELKNIFPTLAYQLACHYPHFQRNIINIIKKDPTLAHTSLISQLENLLVNPLSGENISCVIVIDALDECIDDQPASAILSVLGRFVRQLSVVKFFITGRPEPRIRTGFRLPLLQPLTQIFLLHEVDSLSINNDIQLYLTQKLTTIAKQRSDLDLPDAWPHNDDIMVLTKKSSGLFIFASTLARFIESGYHEPNERLQLVVSEANNTMHEGYAGIDLLYSQILLHAFSDAHGLEVFDNMRHVLGAIVLAFNPLSRRGLSMILDIPMALISTTLRHLHSVILVPTDEFKEIRIFHKSFPDYLQDHQRCTDPRFHIDPMAHHSNMLLRSLELVNQLERNPCSLLPFTMNQDVFNLPQLLEHKLGSGLQYACGYWARHLEFSPTAGDYVDQVIILMARALESAPQWIEVMSLDNQLEGVIRSMYGLLDWIDKVNTRTGTGENNLMDDVEIQARIYNGVYSEVYAKVSTQLEPEIYAMAYAKTESKVYSTPYATGYTAAHTTAYAKAYATAYTKAYIEAEAVACTRAVAVTHTEISTIAHAHAHASTKAHTHSGDNTEAEARAKVEVLSSLHALATDCLRLSMHFFHPIQQCAQQVYLTALPLSPTSSQLHESWIQNIRDDQLSHVAAFLGAPETWGLLLRRISFRPKEITCIATSDQGIIIASEDVVNIYNPITFVLQQSLRATETVTKIQGSPDGAILFFAHSSATTMWDVQTGGLIHTFTTRPEINDITVSAMGDHIACGSSDGSVAFWNIHTKEGNGFGVGEPVQALDWSSPLELVVATQNAVYIITANETLASFPIPGSVWGMVSLDSSEILVGTSQSILGGGQKLRFHRTSGLQKGVVPLMLQPSTCLGHVSSLQGLEGSSVRLPMYPRGLLNPTLVGHEIACIIPPSGVQLFDTRSYSWTNNPPLLDEAISVAASLNRNLVVQTKDFVQFFFLDVLGSSGTHAVVRSSQVYPLGEEHIICLQPNRHLLLLELETLQEIHPTDEASILRSNQWASVRAPFSRGLVAEFGVFAVVEAWGAGTPIPERTEPADEDAPSYGWSPKYTRIVAVYGSPRREIHVRDKRGAILAKLPLQRDDLRAGEVYDLTFDSEDRFYLKIDGPGWHVQIPYEIIVSPSGRYSHTITKWRPVFLPEPRARQPYTLDANYEWVLDAEDRKICWISPGDIRRGNGGHFWAGLSLVMVGDDGVVRKLSFREPDYWA